MAALRLALAAALGLALLAPIASAASAQGALVSEAVDLPGPSTIEALGLDVQSVSTEAPGLTLTLTDVSIHRVGQKGAAVGGPAPGRYTHAEVDERADFQDASLTLETGAGEQIAAIRSRGPTHATFEDAQLRGVAGVMLANANLNAVGECGEHNEGYCLDAFGVHELTGLASAQLTGDVSLLLYGPTLVIETASGTTRYASGVSDVQEAGVARVIEDAWVVVHGKSAQGSLVAPGAATYATTPTVHATQATFAAAEGAIKVGLRDHRANGENVAAVGRLVLTPAPVAPAPFGVDGAPAYADSFTTRVQGDVTAIDLGADSVFIDSPAAKAGAAALVAGAAASIAYYWPRLAFGAAALYTRLNKPQILDNDVRNHIYEIIRLNPGISAREVHRRSTQSWGTVVYHLRQLERHHLVVSRNLGRTRNYYENHGKYRGMEAQLACLQSDRARRLARAIAAQPGITQEQLAAQSGFPQPTTSYYVRKLKQAGLVEEQREGRYARYLPHAELPRFILLSESDLSAAPGPATVQA